MLPIPTKKQSNFSMPEKNLVWRTFAAFLHDVVSTVLAWIFAYLLRFNFQIPPEFFNSIWQVALFVVPIQALFFIQFGLYKGIWRFASIPDLKRILMAIAMSSMTVSYTHLDVYKRQGQKLMRLCLEGHVK